MVLSACSPGSDAQTLYFMEAGSVSVQMVTRPRRAPRRPNRGQVLWPSVRQNVCREKDFYVWAFGAADRMILRVVF